MIKINLKSFNIEKDDKLIIAVSGGPDSMCLLDLLVKNNFKPIVCHVNYNKRETAKRDEKIVENYCISSNLVYFKKDYQPVEKGNFQDNARIFRYRFFKEIYDQNECKALLVAHQIDDCLETYLFRKERNSKSKYLTIVEDEINFGMRIVRPLLKYHKEELLDYCNTKKIEYGIDESNLKNDYTRNKIRNVNLASKSSKEINLMIKEMKKDCKKWDLLRKRTLALIVEDKVDFLEFKKLNEECKNIILCELISKNCPALAHNLSGGKLRQIVKDLDNKQNYAEFCLENHTYLVRQENNMFIYEQKPNFHYFLTSLDNKPSICKEDGEKMEGISVDENDFPLIIRTPSTNDVIEIKDGHHKTLDKLFNDKKIPHCIRFNWIVIENKDGKIIFVNKLYRDYSRINLQNNLFIL